MRERGGNEWEGVVGWGWKREWRESNRIREREREGGREYREKKRGIEKNRESEREDGPERKRSSVLYGR